jgi:hypothetical protein
MTTTPQASMCECEECLALRAAEDDPGSGETGLRPAQRPGSPG